MKYTLLLFNFWLFCPLFLLGVNNEEQEEDPITLEMIKWRANGLEPIAQHIAHFFLAKNHRKIDRSEYHYSKEWFESLMKLREGSDEKYVIC